jgi:hypothetical protein
MTAPTAMNQVVSVKVTPMVSLGFAGRKDRRREVEGREHAQAEPQRGGGDGGWADGSPRLPPGQQEVNRPQKIAVFQRVV